MERPNDPDFAEPKKLGEALRALEKERVFVPARVDETVLGEARKHLGQKEELAGEPRGIAWESEISFRTAGRKPRVHPRVRRWHRWLPLAASIAIAGIILFFSRASRIVAGDVNRDGAVDVIDAMLLAQRVRSGEPTASAWDLNGDGRVDAGDSEEILARAVDLERGGS